MGEFQCCAPHPPHGDRPCPESIGTLEVYRRRFRWLPFFQRREVHAWPCNCLGVLTLGSTDGNE